MLHNNHAKRAVDYGKAFGFRGGGGGGEWLGFKGGSVELKHSVTRYILSLLRLGSTTKIVLSPKFSGSQVQVCTDKI